MKRIYLIYSLLALLLLPYCNSIDKNSLFSQTIDKKYKENIGSMDSANSVKTLVKEIESVLEDKKLLKTRFGIAIYSIDRERSIFLKNADSALTPASTTKLFTTFSALNKFGKDWTINTSIYTDGEMKSDGSLNGNLILYGRGDALLNISDIEYLASQISSLGIKNIKGNIYADGSFFDTKTDRLSYSGDKDRVEPLPPITSLSLEKNSVTVLVTSGKTPGKSVNATLLPPSDAYQMIINAKVTGATKSVKSKIRKRKVSCLQDNYLNRVGDSPKSKRRKSYVRKGGISISTKEGVDGKQIFYINGTLPLNRSYSYSYLIKNPALVAAGALRDRLELFGIKVNGKIAERKNSNCDSLRLLTELKRRSVDLIYVINKNSDNYLAENLFKSIGAHTCLNPDNAQSMRSVESQIFEKLPVHSKSCILYDGSGLSRRNKLTANSLLSLLLLSHKSGFYREFDSCLSIAGVDGTLRNRMLGTRAENNLHAKTGTHGNVSALCGYVTTLDGERFAFAFIFNGPQVGFYKQIEDKLGVLLADFFYFHESTAKN